MSETGMSESIMRVLLVEDDDAQRKILTDILRDEGYDPVSCADAAEALLRAGQEIFPVAVVDQKLPDMTGLEVLERLALMSSDTRVIIHTAYGSFDSARDAVNLGAFAYVEKLGDPQQLVTSVHRATDAAISQALWETDEALRAVTRFAEDFIIQVDREGTVAFSNRELPAMSSDDLPGASLFDWIDPEYHDAFDAFLKRLFEIGRAPGVSFLAPGAGGSPWWYECRGGPIVSEGAVLRGLLIIRDMTTPKKAEIVQRVMKNLIQNASDAIAAGGQISVETCEVVLDDEHVANHPGARAGRHLVITVRDTGEGMDQKTLDRIFEPFFSTRSEGERMGLGLASVYGLVARAGGHLTVESDPGKGTIFRVYIPCADDPITEI